MERQMLRLLKSGESFFTSKDDRNITAVAGQVGVKVKTEKYLAIDRGTTKKFEYILKVTIL